VRRIKTPKKERHESNELGNKARVRWSRMQQSRKEYGVNKPVEEIGFAASQRHDLVNAGTRGCISRLAGLSCSKEQNTWRACAADGLEQPTNEKSIRSPDP
jgi:hypothetical protein